jgi:nucleotide-binding universal stress UspA family protein
VPALFIGPEAQGFVDEASGEMRLTRVLVPVAHEPSPRRALTVLADLLGPLGVPPSALQLLHVGDTPPEITPPAGADWVVELTTGPVVETILDQAAQRLADLIAMPTAGRQGVLDALKGSTTERVVRHAPCPLLALHAS